MKRILALALLLIMALCLILNSCGNVDETTTKMPTDDTTTTAGGNGDDSAEKREELENKVEKILESKHKLTFNDDGSFRVLILADMQDRTEQMMPIINPLYTTLPTAPTNGQSFLTVLTAASE